MKTLKTVAVASCCVSSRGRSVPSRSPIRQSFLILLPEVEGSGAFNCVTKRKRNVATKTSTGKCRQENVDKKGFPQLGSRNVAKKMSPTL